MESPDFLEGLDDDSSNDVAMLSAKLESAQLEDTTLDVENEKVDAKTKYCTKILLP